MPIWILNFVGVLRKHWKIFVAVVILLGVFFAGVKYSDAKHARQRAYEAEQVAKAITAREQALREQHRLEMEREAEARVSLQTDLATLRQREKTLIEGIRTAQLTKPPTSLICEAIVEEDDEKKIIVANPFSSDFVRLWNETSRNTPSPNPD